MTNIVLFAQIKQNMWIYCFSLKTFENLSPSNCCVVTSEGCYEYSKSSEEISDGGQEASNSSEENSYGSDEDNNMIEQSGYRRW